MLVAIIPLILSGIDIRSARGFPSQAQQLEGSIYDEGQDVAIKRFLKEICRAHTNGFDGVFLFSSRPVTTMILCQAQA